MNVLFRLLEVELVDGSYAVCPAQDESQFFEGTKRSLLPVSKSTVYDKVRGAILNRRKQGHTSEGSSRCANIRCANFNGAIPQVSVVIGQRDATHVPLARRSDTTNKGVWAARILFIGGHAPLNLPRKEELVYTPVHCIRNHKELTQLCIGSGSHTVKGRQREGYWHAWRWEWRYHETREVGPMG